MIWGVFCTNYHFVLQRNNFKCAKIQNFQILDNFCYARVQVIKMFSPAIVVIYQKYNYKVIATHFTFPIRSQKQIPPFSSEKPKMLTYPNSLWPTPPPNSNLSNIFQPFSPVFYPLTTNTESTPWVRLTIHVATRTTFSHQNR